ncbi:hypothetical protein PVAP13_9NG411000 [Panicum virgatum]|nr:hypothetical protein PVAP13_9NG411000 [Panicum virgatum]
MFEQYIYRRKKGAPREVKGRLCGQRTNAGRIIKESYGTAKQQHTFTIEILWSKGYKPWPPLHPLLIKGRNLYKDKTMRQPWPDEEERNKVIQEKHERGDLARKSRAARINEKENQKLLRLNKNRIKDNKIKEQQNMKQKQPQEPQQIVKSTNILQQRVGERKDPSPQNGEPGNPRPTSSHHNEVFPHKGATGSFKQVLSVYQIPKAINAIIKMEDRSKKCFQIPLVLSKCSRTTTTVINKEMKSYLRCFQWELPGKHS